MIWVDVNLPFINIPVVLNWMEISDCEAHLSSELIITLKKPENCDFGTVVVKERQRQHQHTGMLWHSNEAQLVLTSPKYKPDIKARKKICTRIVVTVTVTSYCYTFIQTWDYRLWCNVVMWKYIIFKNVLLKSFYPQSWMFLNWVAGFNLIYVKNIELL